MSLKILFIILGMILIPVAAIRAFHKENNGRIVSGCLYMPIAVSGAIMGALLGWGAYLLYKYFFG